MTTNATPVNVGRRTFLGQAGLSGATLSGLADAQSQTASDDLALNYHLMHPGDPSAPGDPNAAFGLDGLSGSERSSMTHFPFCRPLET